jgi:bifunctional non-homologous end joining protein LigD
LEYGVRRLAIQVEDHDLDYIDFQGTIPEGHYGAGQVMIWDNGNYILESRTDDSIQVVFEGRKLKGRYNLIKTAKGWLFFRSK